MADTAVESGEVRGVRLARADAVEIGLLGPLTVRRGDDVLDVTGPKRRALLTLLALELGRPVGSERIVEALWPTRRSGREDATLRVHVSNLRDVLEPERGGADPRVLLTTDVGYVLSDLVVSVDVLRFRRLAEDGRSALEDDPRRALDRLDEALRLWRGRPLADVEYEEFAQPWIRELDRQRDRAVVDRAAARTTLGEAAAVVTELEPIVRREPTWELPVRLLMAALYATGRQADALRAARRHVRVLREQGLDPSPALRRLEERILQHDQTLLPVGSTPLDHVAPGHSVRGYDLRERIGAGSVGVVYRAFQPSLGRDVAVKVVHPHLAETPAFVRRFAEEAAVLASLEHPHVVPLHDHWREPAGAFLVMRWMPGGSLAERLDRPVDDAQLLRTFEQVGDALEFAHGEGIVHRDVTPANVLYDDAGNAYLSDFGLAVAGSGGRTARGGADGAVQPYAAPEALRNEPPTTAWDVFALGVLLATVTADRDHDRPGVGRGSSVEEVIRVASAPDPGDRYPDVASFRRALRTAIGAVSVPAPRRVRRNPYKGLAAFDEQDRSDFYGRDDVVEALVDAVARRSLVAVIGASGSGKSSVVMAGLLPELRDGAVPGSEEWAIVRMVPGVDPFEEFHVALRDAAVGHVTGPPGRGTGELRHAIDTALDSPSGRALLVVDQFEELFSSAVDEEVRARFLDELVELARDPARRVPIVVTLRADFADRPLAHPVFGDLVARSSVLLAPMSAARIEDAIRLPASRVGIEVEPGLVAEIVRDVAEAPASLPLLQYVLTGLFEERTHDRLTVAAYRRLSGVDGVLERRAEETFRRLPSGARDACRRLFLRLVHLGDGGEETRRRLPLTELPGLADRAQLEAVREAFTSARLVTYDRDPVTRVPTIEVAHETVIRRWTRYRVWIDDARADLRAHRRLTAAAAAWADAGEDPAFLLTGGPLAAAQEIGSGDRVGLNALERRFVAESARGADEARELEASRRRREVSLASQSRRRLRLGVAAVAVAAVVAGVAGVAVVEGRRADDLAAARRQQADAARRESAARELAAASVGALDSGDADLSLLLAIEGAEQQLEAGEELLPEVVEALHRAVVNPRPRVLVEGGDRLVAPPRGGTLLRYTSDGQALAALDPDGRVALVAVDDGRRLASVGDPDVAAPPAGFDLHPDGDRVLTVHADGARVWRWSTGEQEQTFLLDGEEVSAATFTRDGTRIAIGGSGGSVAVHDAATGALVTSLDGHAARVRGLAAGSDPTRLLSTSSDTTAVVWDLEDGSRVTELRTDRIVLPFGEVAWHPSADAAAVTTFQGELLLYDLGTGERLTAYGNGSVFSEGVAFDSTGSLVAFAGIDGSARIFGTWTGGETAVRLSAGGVPVRGVALHPDRLEAATLSVDGTVAVWEDLWGSELEPRPYPALFPSTTATPDGRRYVYAAHQLWFGIPPDVPSTVEVRDGRTGETLLSRPTRRGFGLPPGVAITDDGTTIAYQGVDGDVVLADVATGAERTVAGSSYWTASLDFSPDGSLLAGGATVDGTVAVWDVASTGLHRVLRGGEADADRGITGGLVAVQGRIGDVVFGGDDWLVAASEAGEVRRWDVDARADRLLRTTGLGGQLALSPVDGALAVADRVGNVELIDPATGDRIRRLASVPGETHLAFSPDGSLLVGAGPGRLAHVWDVGSGRIVRRLQGAIYPPRAAAFVGDASDEVRVVGGSGTDRGYALDPLDLLDIARSALTPGRALTEEECTRVLGGPCL